MSLQRQDLLKIMYKYPPKSIYFNILIVGIKSKMEQQGFPSNIIYVNL